MQEVNEIGGYSLPTGRSWKFKTYPNFRGELEWPRTQILNYKVQGFSADIMKLVRIAAFNRIKKNYPNDKVKFIATVHDDVELDVDNIPEMIYNICIELENVCSDLPKLYEKYFKQPFNVPMSGEVSYGPTLADMTKFKHGEQIICKFK